MSCEICLALIRKFLFFFFGLVQELKLHQWASDFAKLEGPMNKLSVLMTCDFLQLCTRALYDI